MEGQPQWTISPGGLSDPQRLIYDRVKDVGPDFPGLQHLLHGLVPVLASMPHLEFEATLTHPELLGRLQLSRSLISALKGDVKAARKKAEKAQAQDDPGAPPAVEDLKEVLRRHPAIDFQGETVSLGFRVPLPDGEDGLLMVVSDGERAEGRVNPEFLNDGTKRYQIGPGTPPQLADVWSLDRVKGFLDYPAKPKDLYGNMVAAYREYLDLPEAAYGLLAVWSISTYFSPLFSAVPFLNFHGPKESGKSKSLEALRFVCFNAFKGRDITAAALGDTCETLRGTVLIDQAERLNNDQENGNLIGLLADSYKKAGGQRRIIEMTDKGRRVLEFSCYGPKVFASTKNLDQDLKDRCVKIPMIRTRRKLPDLMGNEPVWLKLRDKCYCFLLMRFKEVAAAYEAIPGDGTRITELWRPLAAVLEVLDTEVFQEEAEAIKALFMGAAEESQDLPSGWELTLLESLAQEAETETGDFELTATEIKDLMDIEGEKQPGPKWIGETLSKYSLYQSKGRTTKKEKKMMVYKFDPSRVVELTRLYLREDMSTSVQANEDTTGQTRTCPAKKVCPAESLTSPEFEGGGQTGQTISGGTPKEKKNAPLAPTKRCREWCRWYKAATNTCRRQQAPPWPQYGERCDFYRDK